MSAVDARPLVKNAADREQVKRAGAREKLAAEQALADLKYVMRDPAGRRFVWRLVERGAPFSSPYRANSLDMAHACGLGDQARQLWAELFAYCPELLMQMAKENAEESNHD